MTAPQAHTAERSPVAAFNDALRRRRLVAVVREAVLRDGPLGYRRRALRALGMTRSQFYTALRRYALPKPSYDCRPYGVDFTEPLPA